MGSMARREPFELALVRFLSAPARRNTTLAASLRVLEVATPLGYVATFAVIADRARDDEEVLTALVRTAAAGSLAVLAAGVVARALPRPRPPLRLWSSRRRESDLHAFPSDHTAGAVAFFLASRGLPRWARCVLCAVAAATACSRLLLGRHWPTDVLASILLAALSASCIGHLEGLSRRIGRVARSALSS